MITRRGLLKGALGGAAALILPPTVSENAEAAGRRYWSLDREMCRGIRRTLRVSDFGAVGDGVTDDTAAIARAIKAAHRCCGGTLIFDVPRMIITEPLEFSASNMTYEGAGSLIEMVGDNPGPAFIVIPDPSVHDVFIRNFTVLGNVVNVWSP
jgi:hypothetical protein